MNLQLYGIVRNWVECEQRGCEIRPTAGIISIESQYESPQRDLWERRHKDPLDQDYSNRVDAIYGGLSRYERIQLGWWYFGASRAHGDKAPPRVVRLIAEQFERKVAREFGIYA